MKIVHLITAAAATALLAGAASAQTMGSSQPVNPTPNTSTTMTDDAVRSSGMTNTTDSTMAAPMTSSTSSTWTTAPTGMRTDVVSTSSPEQQAMLKAGDANVVSNGPVADTPENRAKYGAPMSRAGKRTDPAGN